MYATIGKLTLKRTIFGAAFAVPLLTGAQTAAALEKSVWKVVEFPGIAPSNFVYGPNGLAAGGRALVL